MGAGASSSKAQQQELNTQLLVGIKKLSSMKPSKLLTGEQVEETIGRQLYDCNAFDILAVPDNSKRGQGVYKVSREELLKALQLHQVLNNADAIVPQPSASELEQMEQIMLARNMALSAARSPANGAGLRGAVAPLSFPDGLYTPLPPLDADAATVAFPYAAARVLIFQRRPPPDAGWNLALWRSASTGEWSTITANFAGRHEVSAAKQNQLRGAAAEALVEQTCGLLRVAPGRQPVVLRDACSTSVVWDGGPPLDAAAHPRPLIQLFALHVDGLSPDDLNHNRAALERNLAGALPPGAWLDFDDLAFARIEDCPRLLHPTPYHTRNSAAAALTDTRGRLCPCRQLLEVLTRPRVRSALTPQLPEALEEASVLSELLAKLEAALKDLDGDGEDDPSEDPPPQSYHAGRWFAAQPEDGPAPNALDGTVVMGRNPESCGGLLAGCDTALLTSTSTRIVRSSLW